MDEENLIQCSFCGEIFDSRETIFFKGRNENVFVCEHCIALSFNIISKTAKSVFNSNNSEENTEYNNNANDIIFNKPEDYKNYLDQYIINQDFAKQIFSVAIYNHIKKYKYNIENKNNLDALHFNKSNVLMIGPSGSGKTLMIETMAKKLKIPYSITDATTLTEAGYVGNDVEIVLKKLIENANGSIEEAEHGIVFIDEIDKLGRKGENPSLTRDVGSEGVQQALLKMLDGTIVDVQMSGGRRNPFAETVKIDTSNILFVCSGAFEGIEKIIKKRLVTGTNTSLLKADYSQKEMSFNELIINVNANDLTKFGMLPELLGRLPVICAFEKLLIEALIKILTEPKNAIIKQYVELFKLDNVEAEFTDDFLVAVAEKAIKLNTGARSLGGILEKYMTKYMYQIPSDETIKKVIFTKKSFLGEEEPIFERK